MIPSASDTDYIVENWPFSTTLCGMTSTSAMTTPSPPTYQLTVEDVQNLDDIDVEAIEEHEYEYLISAKSSQ